MERQVVNMNFPLKDISQADDYTQQLPQNTTEASKLIEAGFEDVCDIEGIQLFRKRK